MKKAILLTAFLNYDWNIRIKYLKDYLIKQGYSVCVISSDFDHRNKKVYFNSEALLVHVPKYKTNLSFKRMWSHYVFSKKSVEIIRKKKPDLIYAITPPNFMFYYLNKFKAENENVYIVCETEDLWPEALPISNTLKRIFSPLLNIWAKIRNENLNCADAIVFECNHFKRALSTKIQQDIKIKTIYLSKDDTFSGIFSQKISDQELGFLYLGSVNNLIDCEMIISILDAISKKRKLVFHIVGNGENMPLLESLCKKKRINYINHGAVYDNDKKEKIISNCHFAFNIMKEQTYVGATMKSLEYFHYGIPIINNIPGDTYSIVTKYHCGINWEIKKQNSTIEELLSISNSEYYNMKVASRNVYLNYFSPASFEKAIADII